MITDSNHQVFFAYREAVAQGQNGTNYVAVSKDTLTVPRN
jgi:hypothetical protein